jgi:hypothetical protein
MSIHQAKLWAGTPERTPLDEGAVDAWRSGELDLGRALGVPLDALVGLRQLALSLVEAGKWARARDVAAGLVTLGHVHAIDALVIARACAELGDDRFADAATAHARRLLVAKGVTLAVEPTIATLRALVERLEPDWAADVKAEWDRQKRLASTVRSLECLVAAPFDAESTARGSGHGARGASTKARRATSRASANARTSPRGSSSAAPEARGSSSAATEATGARSDDRSTPASRDIDALARVARTLEAAGASAAVNAFPRGALEAARQDALARARAGATRAGARDRAPDRSRDHTRDVGGRRDSDTQRWVDASGLGARLGSAATRAKNRERFERLVDVFIHLVDQASAAPSYCATRTGWHYPATKSDYLARRYEAEVAMISESRWEASAEAAARALEGVALAPEPEGALEQALVTRFLVELGFDAARMCGAHASTSAVVELVERELLIPLRALNETLLDLDGEVDATRDERRAAVDGLLTELVGGAHTPDGGPRSAASIEALTWASKTGAPGRGFDAEPAALFTQLFPTTKLSRAPRARSAQRQSKE